MLMATLPAENLTLYGDYLYYYRLAAYSDQGYLPFIHYWSEYPPIFPFLSVLVYQLGHLFGGGYHVYVYLMGFVMLVFNTGNLILFLRLARRLRGDTKAEQLGWVYSVLFVPLIYTWWNFDAITVFTFLLTLDLLMLGCERCSAVVMGVGGMVKLLPFLIFPVVMRTRPWRRWLIYGIVVALVLGLIVIPLLLLGGPVAIASFRSPGSWSSWQTVWALLDGNMRTGLLGPPSDHFDLAKATTPVGNPPVAPEWIKLLFFGAIYAVILLRARLRENPRRMISFVGLTFVLFLLWSKGWSPQWQTFLFPLLLLILPLRRSLLIILVLSFISLAEWPVMLSRGLNQWLYLTVPLRTGVFVLLAVDLWQRVK